MKLFILFMVSAPPDELGVQQFESRNPEHDHADGALLILEPELDQIRVLGRAGDSDQIPPGCRDLVALNQHFAREGAGRLRRIRHSARRRQRDERQYEQDPNSSTEHACTSFPASVLPGATTVDLHATMAPRR
jgi:hypothetical protein